MVLVTGNKIYSKIWKIDKKERYADLRISTSEKVEKDGNTEYINSNWFARAVGKAFNQLKDYNEGDNAVITKAKLSNETYEKDEQKRNALRFIIMEFESKGDETPDAPETQGASDSEEDLPF